MGKAKMIGMNKLYIPNNRADQRRAKTKQKWARNIREIATPVCGLVRNDRIIFTGQKEGKQNAE